MKLSESRSYRNYVVAQEKGDALSARQFLHECIVDADNTGDLEQRGYLRQKMGELFFQSGDPTEARRWYDLAEDSNAESLLLKFYYAQFLAEHLKDTRAALTKCDEVIEAATQRPFLESEADFGSNAYVGMATELRKRILAGDF
jgi:hypothetical protein